MKKKLPGFLLVLMSFQAMAVGHPHNLFAARKQLKAKEIAVSPAPKLSGKTVWAMLHQVKAGVETGSRLLTMLHKLTD